MPGNVVDLKWQKILWVKSRCNGNNQRFASLGEYLENEVWSALRIAFLPIKNGRYYYITDLQQLSPTYFVSSGHASNGVLFFEAIS
jgi:hypothetical protein